MVLLKSSSSKGEKSTAVQNFIKKGYAIAKIYKIDTNRNVGECIKKLFLFHLFYMLLQQNINSEKVDAFEEKVVFIASI